MVPALRTGMVYRRCGRCGRTVQDSRAKRCPHCGGERVSATVIRRQQQPISDEEYTRVLAALDQRHEELGAVGGGGTRDTALYVLTTDRYDFEAPAAMEMLEAVADALRYAGLADAWPRTIEIEQVEDETRDEDDEPFPGLG
jgi:hypothetical protein